jgi:arginase
MTSTFLTPFFLDRPAPELRTLVEDEWSINQPSSLPDDGLMPRLAAINEGIAAFVERTIRRGERPLCISGDCCAAIGAVTGLQRAGIAPRLVWLDAHGDFNTPETTPSGFLGGMPLAMLTGRGDLTLLNQLRTQVVDDSAVVLSDARDLDPLERDALASSSVIHVKSVEALRSVDFGDAPVHVHFDPDIITPVEAPAMPYATPGGPTVADLERVLSAFAARTHIGSVSLTAWAVDRDASGETRTAVWRVLRAVLEASSRALP